MHINAHAPCLKVCLESKCKLRRNHVFVKTHHWLIFLILRHNFTILLFVIFYYTIPKDTTPNI
jgi:hypothetical protein